MEPSVLSGHSGVESGSTSPKVGPVDFVANECFADCVAKASHSFYEALPKTGKPRLGQEWTLMSAVVQADNNDWSDHNHPKLRVVALGTGSKCIGQNKMSDKGDILNDSHAEVIARRAFLRYLYHQISNTTNENKDCIFSNSSINGMYELRSNISFHFYTSHTPCGDASIFPKIEEEDNVGLCVGESEGLNCTPTGSISNIEEDATNEAVAEETFKSKNKRHRVEGIDLTDSFSKRQKSSFRDVYRTGAKCVPNAQQDPKVGGLNYHVLGAVRTKPGRGDPTLSVACSDKLLRWNCVGVQGALISRLLTSPIYFLSITIGGGCPFSNDAIERGLILRVADVDGSYLPKSYKICHPHLKQATVSFPYRKTKDTGRPCSSSIIWCDVPYRNHEIAVDGRKQGVTKKNLVTDSGRLMICKKELLRQFTTCYLRGCATEEEYEGISNATYYDLKACAQSYKEAWHRVQDIAKLPWTKKSSHLELFTSM